MENAIAWHARSIAAKIKEEICLPKLFRHATDIIDVVQFVLVVKIELLTRFLSETRSTCW